MENSEYTLAEEIVNSITHGLGVLLGITCIVLMTVFAAKQHDVWKIVAGALFGGSIVMLYLASTLYHSIHFARLRRALKTLDHSSIYLLIAGSYTPFCLVTLRGEWGWTLFGIVWGIALLGIFFKLFFVYRFNLISTILYLVMGWLVLIAARPLITHLPFAGLMWLLAGGLCYTLGVIFYLNEKLPFAHGIWHLLVLIGTICHFFAVLFFVIF